MIYLLDLVRKGVALVSCKKQKFLACINFLKNSESIKKQDNIESQKDFVSFVLLITNKMDIKYVVMIIFNYLKGADGIW
jgi:hypothetical protein